MPRTPSDSTPHSDRDRFCREPRRRPGAREGEESALISVTSATSDTELGEMLLAEPFAFLSVAAEAITHPCQQPIADLIESLRQVGSIESQAMATAVSWLADAADDDGSGSQLLVPGWLEELDLARIVQAKRRRERPNKMSYLLEVELVGGRIGTLQGRIDHDQDGALTNAWVTDESLATIESLIVSLTKRQPDAFRPVKPPTAANALARAIEASEGAEIASPHVNRWPALRPLVEFALVTWSTS